MELLDTALAALALAGSALFPAAVQEKKEPVTLTNVSFDPTRELTWQNEAILAFKKLFTTMKGASGSWREAQKKFFAEGGDFDHIYQPR